MRQLFILAIALSFSAPAHAKRLSHQAVAFQNTFNGAEAKRLFDALSISGAKPIVNNEGKSTAFSIDGVRAMSHSNGNLDERDACFKKPSYEVSFVDSYNEDAKIDIDEASDCKATKAAKLFTALDLLGGREVLDCSMGGRCGFSASSIFVSRDLSRKGDAAYYAQVIVSSF